MDYLSTQMRMGLESDLLELMYEILSLISTLKMPGKQESHPQLHREIQPLNFHSYSPIPPKIAR